MKLAKVGIRSAHGAVKQFFVWRFVEKQAFLWYFR